MIQGFAKRFSEMLSRWDVTANRVPGMLLGITLMSTVVRFILGYLVPAPYIFGDELVHIRLARSLWEGNGTHWGGLIMNFPCWLYPLGIAPWVGLFEIEHALIIVRWMNAALVSLTIPLAYGLAREVTTPRRALAAAVLTALLPGFGYSPTLMSESLFMPVFTLAVWMSLRSVLIPSVGRLLIAGFVMGAAFHVKPQALYLPLIHAAAVLSFEVCGLARRANGLSAKSVLRIVGMNLLTIIGWLAGLAPRLVAMKWVDGIENPFDLRMFIGSYYGLGTGDYSVGGWRGFSTAMFGSFSVMVAGSGVFPVFTIMTGFRKMVRGELNRQETALLLLAFMASAGCVFITSMLIRSVRIHERYFMVAYPAMIAVFCALSRRGGHGTRICVPWIAWALMEAAFFYFVQRKTLFADWFIWVDSPTFSFFHFRLHPSLLSPMQFALVGTAGLVTGGVCVVAGNNFQRRAAALAVLFGFLNLGWYLQHNWVTRKLLQPYMDTTAKVLETVSPAQRLLILTDHMHSDVLMRVAFHTEGELAWLREKRKEWFVQALEVDASGRIMNFPLNEDTWLMTSEKIRTNQQPVLKIGGCALYRFQPGDAELKFLSSG